jgi:DNA (cytosine-5)-methyltransferase 1
MPGSLSLDAAPLEHPTAERTRLHQALGVAALFAGVGGIERGLALAGHHVVTFCEADPAAVDVLRDRFVADVPLSEDVADLKVLPRDAALVAAGFPCQDLSQAGRTAGINGGRSGLVDHVFRLLTDRADNPPRWLLLENVPFMLQLDGGRAMHRLTEGLAELGYRWAYRVVDTRAFGLPQRRRRVLMLASATEDPRGPLLAQDAGEPPPVELAGRPCGFYWTEGLRGLGLAIDSVPTLKGGSTIGIPSPPGIWIPGEGIFTPDVRDAERLQGFDADWTRAADQPGRRSGVRWKLVGNAVSVPVAKWLGRRIRQDCAYSDAADIELAPTERWPDAAWGDATGRWQSPVSAWPQRTPIPGVLDFLDYPLRPLSARASAGFLSRARTSTLRFPDGFLADVAEHHRTLAAAA